MEPKMYIDTEEELIKLAKEWQARLLLSDWAIGFALVPCREMTDIEWAGESNVQFVNRCGTVSILRKEDIPKDLICKQPMECVLIHELLHFKFMTLESSTLEGCYWNEKQHQLLEDMAKALYMAKYNLQMDWFKEEKWKGNL